MNIVWLESETLAVPLPRPACPHQWTEYPYTSREDVHARIADADILIINKVKIGQAELAAAPRLKMIQLVATGMDNVDQAACKARGVKVSNVVNYGPGSVAEHAMACILQLTRRVPEWQTLVHDGSWSASRFFCLHTLPMNSLDQMTLGILGSGAIGGKLGDFARAFGMTVVQIERQGASSVRDGYVSFEHGLSHCDVISLHCPLNEQTRGLFGDAVIAKMKPGAILVNTARGALVQFAAVKAALERGHLGGVALDVLDVEPPPKDHLMVSWQHPRCIITPHIAWGTESAQSNVGRLAIKHVDEFLAQNQ
ncbi:MAG TPA: D-2-hydroxyacid dehydrogenase [Limnobacter sp.]|nr:D-2-hydroxyacid dehydrogenase [Limnobacter sp.]